MGHVTQSRAATVDCIRREVQTYMEVKECGRFLIVNVGEAKAATLAQGCTIRIIFTPKPNKPSHTSIIGLPVEPVDDEIGTAADMLQSLLRCITADNIYPGLLT